MAGGVRDGGGVWPEECVWQGCAWWGPCMVGGHAWGDMRGGGMHGGRRTWWGVVHGGGMRGRGGGMCGGGMHGMHAPPPTPDTMRSVNERAVRILLECILVF